jgi:pimeloyl-ACP methyl ester carboxylesterase
MAGDPTIVLIHGGGTSAGFWDRLVPHLDAPAIAIDLPGRAGKPADPMTFTVAEGVASIVVDIGAADPVILVAHSSGGLFVPGVATAIAPRVVGIVLSAASVPPEGGCGLDCMKPKHRDRVVAAIEAARRDGWVLTTPGAPDDPEVMRTAYGIEIDDATLEFVNDPARAIRDSMNFYFQSVSWATVGPVPVTYVKNLHDRAVPPDLQDEMIARLPYGCTVIELDTGHVPAVTDPAEFAAIVNGVAR